MAVAALDRALHLDGTGFLLLAIARVRHLVPELNSA